MSVDSVDQAEPLLRGWDIMDGCDDALLNEVKYFHAFSDMGALFVTSKDEVYGIGQNGEYNLLGVEGDDFLQEVLEQPSKVIQLWGKGVIGISVGIWLGAAVTQDGSLYRWGFSSEDSNILLPTHVKFSAGVNFIQVACGATFLAALTDKHQVYMWGSINMCTESIDACLLSQNHSIVSLSCGWWHVAMLTDKGHVYTCGYGEDGQLGYGWREFDDIYYAKKMDIRPVCKQVVCGSISTLCLSTYGEVWACGENDIWQGSLGVDSEEYCIVTPKKVRIEATIREIVATWGSPNIYGAQSTDGRIYCWGESRYPALLQNISSLIEACRNERTSINLDNAALTMGPECYLKRLGLQNSCGLPLSAKLIPSESEENAENPLQSTESVSAYEDEGSNENNEECPDANSVPTGTFAEEKGEETTLMESPDSNTTLNELEVFPVQEMESTSDSNTVNDVCE